MQLDGYRLIVFLRLAFARLARKPVEFYSLSLFFLDVGLLVSPAVQSFSRTQWVRAVWLERFWGDVLPLRDRGHFVWVPESSQAGDS